MREILNGKKRKDNLLQQMHYTVHLQYFITRVNLLDFIM